MSFEQFQLSNEVRNSITKMGFSSPTPIQEQSIPWILLGRDLVGKAQTGSGKTGAYLIPLISKISAEPDAKILVLSPVRELAQQIAAEVVKIGSSSRIHSATICGGKAYGPQIRDAQRAQVVVATPGRLIDLLETGSLKGFSPKYIVIDEADRMLDMGFLDDVKKIFSMLEGERQTLLFSATFPKPIMNLVKSFLVDPVSISLEQENKTNTNIAQQYCVMNNMDRMAALVRILDSQSFNKCLIFSNTKKEADEIAEELNSMNYSSQVLHGDTKQNDRERIMRSFKTGAYKALVATDVAARGLDIRDIDLVINYHLPRDFDTYVHRIGRTGRGGDLGRAISFISPAEIRSLFQMQRILKTDLEFLAIPNHDKVKEQFEADFMTKLLSITPDKFAFEMAQDFLQAEDATYLVAQLIQLGWGTKEMRGPNEIGFKTAPAAKPPEGKPQSKGSFSARGSGRSGRTGGGAGGAQRPFRSKSGSSYKSSDKQSDGGKSRPAQPARHHGQFKASKTQH